MSRHVIYKIQMILIQKLDSLGCVEELKDALISELGVERAACRLVEPIVEAVMTNVVSE